jgi:hypothetical protein
VNDSLSEQTNVFKLVRVIKKREKKICQRKKKMDLHYLILRTATTLWNSPFNIFMGHFNAAALAMNTILVKYRLNQ